MFYLDLFRALTDCQVRYLLVGGLAVNVYGVERATMDVDLMLALDQENLRRFLKAAARLGLTPLAPVPLADLADASKRQDWIDNKHMLAFALHASDPAAPTVDVLIAPAVDFEAAYPRRTEKLADTVSISLAAVDDLIALKRGSGRQRDLADVAALEQLRALGRL